MDAHCITEHNVAFIHPQTRFSASPQNNYQTEPSKQRKIVTADCV